MSHVPGDRTDSPDLADLKVLLVHQWLYVWAGAERCLEELVRLLPRADVVAGLVTPEMREAHPIAARARETWVGRLPGAHAHHRWFLPLHALGFGTVDARGYDLVLSISHGFEKAVEAPAGAAHLCYCLSPPRYFWDLADAYEDRATDVQRAALRAGRPLMRLVDRWAARRVDRFVSISRFVAGRVRRAYGRDSDVVYPPVQLKAGGHAGSGVREPFLLSLGRLVPYKRVDLAVQAAERLGVRLVVAGDGPERRALERLAGPHTELVGEVSEAEAARLLSTCSAFVFCAEEDFGIAPIEANAHGAPVIAYREGAASETMRDGATGVLFDRQDVDALAAAVVRCLDRRWDPAVLRANAERFSPERFRDGIAAAIHRTLGVR